METIKAFKSARYLLPLDELHRDIEECDILIIGGGIAGMAAAIVSCEEGVRVTLVTKDSLEESNSYYAQGGIAAVLDASDTIDLHIKDTIDAGKEFNNREIVEDVISEGPEAIRRLIEWGSEFDKEDGSLSLSKEGGHSAPRVVHSHDMTGKEIQRAMIKKVRSFNKARVLPLHFAVDLITVSGECAGVLLWNKDHGYKEIKAKRTILVTGGAGHVYRETTNPDIATGDGIAMAFRAGAKIRDMEFFQFHPTILYLPGSQRLLISETARGEGGVLRDRYGRRFMSDFHPDMELAPRDTVSRAIITQMASTKYSHVFLDVTHLAPKYLKNRFPHISEVCASYKIDITKDYIPVRPAAHYCIGGVEIDKDGRTSVTNLFAAGEATSSGLHGANRLGSNSLLEGIVFGRRAALSALDELKSAKIVDGEYGPFEASDTSLMKPNILDFRNSVSSLMWRSVGIERSRAELVEAGELFDLWSRLIFRVYFDMPSGWELCNMLTVARLITAGALHREESRGVHFRKDFPKRDDRHWLKSITWTAKGDKPQEEQIS